MSTTDPTPPPPLSTADRVEDAAVVIELFEALEEYAETLDRGRPPPDLP